LLIQTTGDDIFCARDSVHRSGENRAAAGHLISHSSSRTVVGWLK